MVLGWGAGRGQMARGRQEPPGRGNGLCRSPKVRSDVVGVAAVERARKREREREGEQTSGPGKLGLRLWKALGTCFPTRIQELIWLLLGTWHPGIPHPYSSGSSCLGSGSPRSKPSGGLQQLEKGILGLAGELQVVMH